MVVCLNVFKLALTDLKIWIISSETNPRHGRNHIVITIPALNIRKVPRRQTAWKKHAILPRIVAWSVAYHHLSTDPYPRLNAVE
jgi:hypothetical protein